ncbi:Fur-regulated basic protein FbpA [Schinkia sp. CFF1]
MFYNNSEGKDYFIDILLNIGLFKMPDGRQLYEATEYELKKELCSMTNNQYSFCSLSQ